MDRIHYVLDLEYYDMRRKLKIGLIVLFISVLGILAYQFYKTFQQKETQFEKIEYLPKFSLYDTKGILRTQDDTEKDKWTVFVFFNGCFRVRW